MKSQTPEIQSSTLDRSNRNRTAPRNGLTRSRRILAAATLAGFTLITPSASGAVRYWDPAAPGNFGSISTASITWVSPLNIIWTNSPNGSTSRIANYTTTLTDDCTWGGPGTGTTNPLGGGTVPVGTVNAGTLSFRSINGSGSVILSGGTITLASTTSLTALTASQTHTISSTLAGGAASLTKLGAGTIVLSGSNTYTGSTIVSAGTLTLGNSLALQNSALDATTSITGDATNGLKTTVAILTFGGLSGIKDLASLFTTNSGGFDAVIGLVLNPGNAVTNTYSGTIADGVTGMTLTKSGLGTQVLSGANTFTGSTTATAGTLTLDYSTQDNSKLSDTAALVLGSGTIELVGGTHTEVVASTTLTGTAKVKRTSGTAKLAMGAISGTGTVDFAADNIATTTNSNNLAGILGEFATVGGTNYAANDGFGNIVAFAGYLDIDARGPSTVPDNASGNVRIFGDGASGNIELAASTTTISILLQSNVNFAPTINTAAKTLATNGITIVGTAESLNIGAAPGDGTLRSATSGGTLALTNANAAKVLTINAGIADNTTASGLSKGGAGTLVLASPNTYTGATAVSEGTLTLSSSLLTSSITVGTSAVFSETSTGSIAGAATFTHSSVSTSTLAGANTYSGTTVINNGVVNIQNGSALGSTAAGTSVASGAALQIQGDITIGDEALTLSGSGVSNTGALRNISGNNTFGGLVTLGATTRIASDSGTLTLSNPGTITGSTFSLTFAGSGNTIVNSAIGTGSGLLSKEGTGTLTLTGANTFTNTVNISAGVLNIQNSTATGTTAGGVIVTSGAALEMQGDITVGAEALALNSFGVSNGGALRNVSGNNTWGGPLTISTTTSRINSDAGTLTISGSTIAGTGVAVPSPNMIFGGSGNITVADAITTSAGTLTKDGSGTLTLSGVNTFTGATTISAGTLTIGGAGRLNSGSYAAAISNSGTFNYSSSATQTLSGGISGAGAFNQNGPGTLTLSGLNNYTGPITVSAGTLLINGDSSAATGAVAVNGGTLGGSGTLGGNVTVAADGSVAPGASVASAGTLSIGGTLDVSLQAAGTGKLNFELNTIAASDKIAVTGTLTIGSGVLGFSDFVFTDLGSLGVGTYTLITSGGISGTLDAANLSGMIGAFNATLQINGNAIKLVVSPAVSAYDTWSGGAAASVDTNGDGVTNGVAWALGAADPNANAVGLLPTEDNISDPDFFIFTFNRSDVANADPNTSITVQYGDNLSGWITAVHDGTDVIITVTPGSPTDQVQVKLRRSTLGVGGKLFARLNVVVTP